MGQPEAFIGAETRDHIETIDGALLEGTVRGPTAATQPGAAPTPPAMFRRPLCGSAGCNALDRGIVAAAISRLLLPSLLVRLPECQEYRALVALDQHRNRTIHGQIACDLIEALGIADLLAIQHHNDVALAQAS